jgi:hypothetical protein
MSNCLICQKNLNITGNRNKSLFLSTCCSLRYTLSENGNIIYRAEKRFGCNSVLWHMTYRAYEDCTSFVSVKRRIKSKDMSPRTEYKLTGLILPERFLNLLAFL